MKTGVVVLLCLGALATAAPDNVTADAGEKASDTPDGLVSNATEEVSANAPSPATVDAEEEAADEVDGVEQKKVDAADAAKEADVAKELAELPPVKKQKAEQTPMVADAKPPSADEIYSADRKIPTLDTVGESGDEQKEEPKIGPGKATSLGGDMPDIDASVRERIDEDSKRVGSIAENLVGVQGDINRVEKEVLGKVFDMSTMKSFLNQHEQAIKDHEKLDEEQDDLEKQATLLSKQLDKAINQTNTQEKNHKLKMSQLSSQVAEDKAVIQGLQKEMVPLVEMQKEVEKLPPVNANQTAENTKAVAAAQAATEELVYEKSKMKNYQETTKNLMNELVKQHDYATKCHERLYQLNTQLHEIATREARMKYDQSRTSQKGDAMEKYLEEKNALIQQRFTKSKKNLDTINFAKANTKAKIGALQTEGQIQLEKLKAELGKLRQQSASIETAMMAKITNRKLIEKALRGASGQVEDMQAKLLAGRLDKLKRNNTQMSNDLTQIRDGLQKAQVTTAQAEAQRTNLLAQATQMKHQANNKTLEAQNIARAALMQVVAAKADDDAKAQEAEKAVTTAQASMLVKCGALWWKEHAHVRTKLKKCEQTKMDLQSVKASVATLQSSLGGK